MVKAAFVYIFFFGNFGLREEEKNAKTRNILIILALFNVFYIHIYHHYPYSVHDDRKSCLEKVKKI